MTANTETPTRTLRGTILVLISAASFGTTLIFTQRALDRGVTLRSEERRVGKECA